MGEFYRVPYLNQNSLTTYEVAAAGLPIGNDNQSPYTMIYLVSYGQPEPENVYLAYYLPNRAVALSFTQNTRMAWTKSNINVWTDLLDVSFTIDNKTCYTWGNYYDLTIPDDVVPFNTYEEACAAFLDYVPYETKWNIKYISINCSLTGETSVNPNTNVDVTIAPYPQAEFIGATVYYSGGTIEHTITGNTLSFTTPNITT